MTIPHALSSSKKPPAATSDNLTIFTNQHREPKRKGARPNGHRGKNCFGMCVGIMGGIIVLIFVGSALLLLRAYIFSLNYYTGYHDGDQVLVSHVADNYNSLLCQTYEVNIWNSGASVYLTDGPATISQDKRVAIFIDNPGLRSQVEFDYKAFYLLPGSVIETTACMSVFNEAPLAHAEVLFIKGSAHFGQWANDASCSSCLEHRVTITPDALCEALGSIFAHYVIKQADTYYVVITRQHRAEDDVPFKADVSMKVIKTVYDISHPKQECLGTSNCILNLSYNSNDDVILQFPIPEFSPSSDLWDESFNTNCGIRKNFFVIVFAIIPASIICILTLVSCLCCMHQDARAQKQHFNIKKAEVRAALIMPDQQQPQVPDQQEPQATLPPV